MARSRKTEDTEITITIGPDAYEPGTSWGVDDSLGEMLADGCSDRGPRPRGPYPTVGEWLAYASRAVSIRRHSPRWSEAEVKPIGWSPGAGYAPNGVKIVVPARRERPSSRW